MNASDRADQQPASADWKLIGGFALLTILIHFLTDRAYGYFRDELYFIACGQQGAAVCRDPKMPISQWWPLVKKYR